jgi:alkylation response protein AidB-like acyl-CoA dehydrogenase
MLDAPCVTEKDERAARIEMVDASAAGILSNDRTRARALRFRQPGFEPRKWDEFRELGWLMLRLSERDGGLGFGMGELCAIARHMGRELTPEPVLAAALAVPVLPGPQRGEALAGQAIILPAFSTFGAAAPVHQDGRVTGVLEAVPYAAGASMFLVQLDNGAALVSPGGEGVELRLSDTHDGGHAGVLSLRDAPAAFIEVDLAPMREHAALALSAYLLGVAEVALDITLDYLRQRQQFGKPIGAFQALQHRSVDLLMEIWLMRAAIDAASCACDAGAEGNALRKAISLAKARASKASAAVTQAATQLHGGIGYTDEADIGLYLRKVMSGGGLLGTERFHRDRAFKLSGLLP